MSRSRSEISDDGESVASSEDDCNRCGVGGARGDEDAAALSTTSARGVILLVFAVVTAMAEEEVEEDEMTTLSRDWD